MNFHEKKFLEALDTWGVKYLVVGSYAKRRYGLNLTPRDLDVYVGHDEANLTAVVRALDEVDPIPGKRQLQSGPFRYQQFRVTLGPSHADILTDLKGLEFDQAWNAREMAAVGELQIPMLGQSELLVHLAASDRPQDKEHLQRLSF